MIKKNFFTSSHFELYLLKVVGVIHTTLERAKTGEVGWGFSSGDGPPTISFLNSLFDILSKFLAT